MTDLSQAIWRKARRSAHNGGCVEIVQGSEAADRIEGAPIDEETCPRRGEDVDRRSDRIRALPGFARPDDGKTVGGRGQVEAELTNSQVVRCRMSQVTLGMEEERSGGDHVVTNRRRQPVEPVFLEWLARGGEKAQQIPCRGCCAARDQRG